MSGSLSIYVTIYKTSNRGCGDSESLVEKNERHTQWLRMWALASEDMGSNPISGIS